MDVFLVPVGPDRYEPYCEHTEQPAEDDAEPAADDGGGSSPGMVGRMRGRVTGWFRRLKLRFTEMLAEAERDRRLGITVALPAEGWAQRVKRRSMRWVAETIAEQRLLWNLRRVSEACLHHPDDMDGEAALLVLRRHLKRDFEKHRLWLAIDSLLMAASGLLILIPGPNIIGYYFAFRVVGHFFSVRGARNGLVHVCWAFESSAPLTELRRALGLDPAVRLQQVEDVASRLRLDHLATFFQRTATS